jgi:hypothetical protein
LNLKIYGPTQDKGRWGPRWNSEIYNLYKDINIVAVIRWVGSAMRMEDEKVSKRCS